MSSKRFFYLKLLICWLFFVGAIFSSACEETDSNASEALDDIHSTKTVDAFQSEEEKLTEKIMLYKACEDEDGEACYKIAYIRHAEESDSKKRTSVLIKYLRDACTFGHNGACVHVGNYFLTEMDKTQSDEAKVRLSDEMYDFYKKACEALVGEACYQLAQIILTKDGKQAKKEKEALPYFDMACRYLLDPKAIEKYISLKKTSNETIDEVNTEETSHVDPYQLSLFCKQAEESCRRAGEFKK